MSHYLIKPEPRTRAAIKELEECGGGTFPEYTDALAWAHRISQLRGVKHVSVVYVKEHHMSTFTRGKRQ